MIGERVLGFLWATLFVSREFAEAPDGLWLQGPSHAERFSTHWF